MFVLQRFAGFGKPCATDADCAGLEASYCHHQEAQAVRKLTRMIVKI